MPPTTSQIYIHIDGKLTPITYEELTARFPILGEPDHELTAEELHEINLDFFEPEELAILEAQWAAEEARAISLERDPHAHHQNQ